MVDGVLGQDALRPRVTAATVAARVVAVAILAGTLALAGGGAVLAVRERSNPFAVAIGVVLLLTAVAARPRLGRVPTKGVIVRERAPELHALVDEVAGSLRVRRPDVVAIDAELNASWAVVGVRRQRVLTLGLPLWLALGRQARVALLAHELAHERNGDSSRGLVLGSSLDALAAIYTTLSPHGYDGLGPLGDLASALGALLALPVRAVLWAQATLVLGDSQRAEYLADALAADVAGTDAQIALQEALLLNPLLMGVVQRHAVDHRIAFQERRGHRDAALLLDPDRNARIDAELAPLEDAAGRALVEAWRAGYLHGDCVARS